MIALFTTIAVLAVAAALLWALDTFLHFALAEFVEEAGKQGADHHHGGGK